MVHEVFGLDPHELFLLFLVGEKLEITLFECNDQALSCDGDIQSIPPQVDLVKILNPIFPFKIKLPDLQLLL